MVAISLNMYAQNEKISKLWKDMTIKENILNKQYESYENLLKDDEWLLSVENRIIKSSTVNQKQSIANNSKKGNNFSILQLELQEKLPRLFNSDPTQSDSNSNA